MIRPKQGIEEEGGGCSNMSNTILKQGLEGCLGYCANAPMTIGETDYEEGGAATCAQQWKTADIYKRKPAGRLHAEIISGVVVPHHRQANVVVV